IEIVHVIELHFDIDLAAVVRQLVVNAENRSGTDRSENVVEVVAIDLDKLPVLDLGKRLGRLPGEICENADNERQFFLLGGVADLDIISNLYSRRAYSV